MKRTAVVEIISFLFILLFVYAATSKLLDYQKFQVQLGKSPLLTAFAGWVAWIIPAIEIIISVFLAIPSLRLNGLYASFSLMVMFTAYIITITKFSDYIPCSCGGVLQNMSWNQHLVFNIFFVLLAAAGILLHSKLSNSPGRMIEGNA
jgi:uncharacterized membrane protein YphA (DoxX/SURF4 family)